jgi:hypothetical protein
MKKNRKKKNTESPTQGEKNVQKKSTEEEQTLLKHPHGEKEEFEEQTLLVEHPHNYTTIVAKDKTKAIKKLHKIADKT